MAKPTRSLIRFQFSLRSVACLFAFCALSLSFVRWWRTPFEIEGRSWTGLLFRRATVRREWDGQLYYCGSVTDRYYDDQKAVEFEVYGPLWGKPYRPEDGVRFWHQDGRTLTDDEFVAFLCLAYAPTRFGDPPLTEREWRAEAKK